jgi:sec-independent protein translocase protein TatC
VAEVDVVGDSSDRGLSQPLTQSPGASPPPSPSPSPPAAMQPRGEDKVMSLVDHLSELRRRVAIAIATILLGSILGYIAAPRVIELLARPVLQNGPLIFLDVGGAFFLQLKIALAIGFALALPVILYQFWAFVSPGLTPRERRLARPWIPAAIAFFVLGIVVAYVVLPFALSFLLAFQIQGVLRSQLAAQNYFDFVTVMFLGFGVVMQFPIVLVLLTKMGILSVGRLRSSRRYAILAIVVFAVVVTPGGDPISPLVMTAVMYALYEGTIVLLARQERSSDLVRG